MNSVMFASAMRRRRAYASTEIRGPGIDERLAAPPGGPILVASGSDRTAQYFFSTLQSTNQEISWICHEDLIDGRISVDMAAEYIESAPGIYHRDLLVMPGNTAVASSVIKAWIQHHPNLISPSLNTTNWSKPYHARQLHHLHSDTALAVNEWIIRGDVVSSGLLKKAMGWFPAYVELCEHDSTVDQLTYAQARVEGTEYRVHIVDEFLVAHKLAKDGIDYRRDGLRNVSAESLPAEMAQTLVRLSRSEGLRFSGIDVIVNEDGIYVIEVNPMPGYHSYEIRAREGASITNAIYRALRGEVWAQHCRSQKEGKP